MRTAFREDASGSGPKRVIARLELRPAPRPVRSKRQSRRCSRSHPPAAGPLDRAAVERHRSDPFRHRVSQRETNPAGRPRPQEAGVDFRLMSKVETHLDALSRRTALQTRPRRSNRNAYRVTHRERRAMALKHRQQTPMTRPMPAARLAPACRDGLWVCRTQPGSRMHSPQALVQRPVRARR